MGELSPGLGGVLYLWRTVAAEAEVPVAIEHRVSVKVADSEFVAPRAQVPVSLGHPFGAAV